MIVKLFRSDEKNKGIKEVYINPRYVVSAVLYVDGCAAVTLGGTFESIWSEYTNGSHEKPLTYCVDEESYEKIKNWIESKVG